VTVLLSSVRLNIILNATNVLMNVSYLMGDSLLCAWKMDLSLMKHSMVRR